MRIFRSEKHYVCPRCGYQLTPVHARKDAKRQPIGYCCPEPYCDYVQLERKNEEGLEPAEERARPAVSRAG